MVSRLANFSGEQVINILQKRFGFEKIAQKGSHVKLRKTDGNRTTTTIVPNHKELAVGTLHNILRQAQIEINEFLNK